MMHGGRSHRLMLVVGSGGVGKTTLAAAWGIKSALAGKKTLVMTFDPSLRLKDTLGVGEEAKDAPVRVALDAPGTLDASLLDARATFDRLIDRYAPDPKARERILGNRYYDQLAGHLAGILEYMAVERLFEVSEQGIYDQIILDTPPTRQALDFLEAPERIVAFLDSGALKMAMGSWFDDEGHLRPGRGLKFLGRGVEAFLDRIIGIQLLQDMIEFFRAFGPLFEGFRERATQVQDLLRSKETLFALVSGPGEERIPDTMFFARKLEEAGYNLGPVLVNRVHPILADDAGSGSGRDDANPVDPAAEEALELFRWLGTRDRQGLRRLTELLPGREPVALPIEPVAPNDLPSLARLAVRLPG